MAIKDRPLISVLMIRKWCKNIGVFGQHTEIYEQKLIKFLAKSRECCIPYLLV